MLVFVSTDRCTRPTPKSHGGIGWLSVWVALVTACSTTPSPTTDSSTSSGITVTVVTMNGKKLATDGAPPVVSSVVGLAGTIALDKGVALKKDGVIWTMGDTASGKCAVSGKNFTCSVDTGAVDPKTNQPLVGCNETVTLTIAASGTLSGADASGSASFQLEVDNCYPSITLVALPEPVPPALPTMPIFVGTQKLRLRVMDPHLKWAKLDVTDSNGTSILANPVEMPTPATGIEATSWKTDYTLDTTQLPTTGQLTVTVQAQDLSNAVTQATLDVFSVKSALFLGQQRDRFSHSINDFVIPDPAAVTGGFVAFSTSPTPTSGYDNLVDVVVAADDGVYIRAGLPKRNPAGHPIDATGAELDANAAKFVHSLEFEEMQPIDALYDTRVIHWGTADEKKTAAKANVVRVFLRDLDNDGDLDILAVASVAGATAKYGEVWAILNVEYDKTVTMPDGSTLKLTTRAFKVVDTLQLPAPPATAEMADLNGDGLDDLLFGAEKTIDAAGHDVDLGLMTLLLTSGPVCQVVLAAGDTSAPQKPCGDPAITYQNLKTGKFFGDVKVAPNMGVTNVVSIATGDFWTGDGLDVCVGSGNRPIVSCYRNIQQDGTLNQAIDAYQFKNGTDTNRILRVDLPPGKAGGPSGPDLLVGSTSTTTLYWLRTTHTGQFTFVENPAVPNEVIFGVDVQSMVTAPIGPKGETYVVIGQKSGEVTIVPLDPTDPELRRACFRSWMIGDGSLHVAVADVDGDAVLDIANAALWTGHPYEIVPGLFAKSGIQIAAGQTYAKGSFVAPIVNHICAWPYPPTIWGVQKIVAAKVSDFNADKLNDLLVIADMSASSAPGDLGTLNKSPMPVWPMGVFMNTQGQLSPEPLQGEFSPYNPGSVKAAGFLQDLTAGSPSAFGHVKAAAVGDVDGDGLPDLVTVRTDSAYAVGKETDDSSCHCTFTEQDEISDSYGEDGPSGTDTSLLKTCCHNFRFDDTAKATPVTGFGGGAPMLRASTHVFLSSKVSKTGGPLGLSPGCTSVPSANFCNIIPSLALSGGRNPVDVALLDIDNDKSHLPEIVTAMDNDGTTCFKVTSDQAPFLQARVRIFKNNSKKGNAFFQAQTLTDDKKTPRDKIEIASCDDKNSLSPSIVSYRVMPDGLFGLTTSSWPNPLTGKVDPLTLFGLGRTFGQIGILPHLDSFAYAPHVTTPMGGAPDGFQINDINGDGLADMLVLSSDGTQLAVLMGKLNDTAGKDAAFYTQTTLQLATQQYPGAVAAAMGDVNSDTFIDLVLLGKDATITFLLGTGQGTFVTLNGSPVGGGPLALEVADMDGDGCRDIVIRSAASVTVIQNQGASLGDCSKALLWQHEADLVKEAVGTGAP